MRKSNWYPGDLARLFIGYPLLILLVAVIFIAFSVDPESALTFVLSLF